MKKIAAAALAVSCVLTISACTPGDATGGTNQASSTSESQSKFEPMNTIVRNGGIELTVTNAELMDEITLAEDGVQKSAGYTVVEHPKNTNGRFAVITTKMKNDGKKSWDLGCSYHIEASLVDTEDREYRQTIRASRIADNPECGDSIGPGFETPLTWVFEVPDTFEMNGAVFAFFDPEENYGEYSLIELRS